MKYQRKISVRTAVLLGVCCLVCAAGSCGYGGRAWAAERGEQEDSEAVSAGEQEDSEAVSAGEQEHTAERGGQEIVEYVSELYDTREQLPAPEPVMEDGAGIQYYLTSQEVEAVPVAGKSKVLDGEILYQGVDREAEIPEMAEFDVTDEVSRKTFTAKLPLYQVDYEKERWEDSLRFTVTFHEYGADSYVLGTEEIADPEMLMRGISEDEDEYEELLNLIGMTQENCRLESCQWAGDPYRDETGTLCRDALVQGTLRVFDCRAVYRGSAKLPDYKRWRLHAVYTARGADTRVPDSAATAAEVPMTEMDSPPAAESDSGFWEKVKQAVKLCVELTVGLLFLLLLIGGFRLLWRTAKKLDRQWKDSDKRRKR